MNHDYSSTLQRAQRPIAGGDAKNLGISRASARAYASIGRAVRGVRLTSATRVRLVSHVVFALFRVAAAGVAQFRRAVGVPCHASRIPG
ncbi:hypothetical protein E2562_001551 [Oryza meyeriana var. granulata]|uniref:Uncharacterized protein n=1 Tax=Oryza meyeriana var. granulata TaxID=110450 RepID=A0A6G1DDY3_9ORYZ|nr:hypothetical protein E2562_001551 [Oryza meyeriana var. granulata]